jgi:hypothetical protein
MWNWFNCYLSGRHEYGVWCEPGTIFLRCVHCGRRSPGWSLDAAPHVKTTAQSKSAATVPSSRHVIPFGRHAAMR